MTLVPLNKHELDLIIGILKSYKLRITEEKRQPLTKRFRRSSLSRYDSIHD